MTQRDDFLDAKRNIEVLLVEDSPSDAMLTIEALREGCVTERLYHVEDGVEALAYLRREGKYSEVGRPDVVLLDLNMPRKNGHEVLKEIRADHVLQFLPVIVLTTSDDERDVLEAYGENANCYITKPVDLNAFVRAMRSLGDFWLKWVTLPPRTI
ncbi:Response regulator rcp1 [Stieleria neptunia]|uniref:Response regulator rcp1 n=1 Tax=Stieleria neptunia TaxID=2527979 RepID=A0A518HS90_9BACT|nr:response regulator [Stieleria neptunia]QDV43709.1 Response regulator rcp1 [Stieleria neptunia]